MPILVDSNVLLDVLTEDARWSSWSSDALAEHADQDVLAIDPIIYAEVSVGFARIEELDAALPPQTFHRVALPWEAAFLAGKCFLTAATAAIVGGYFALEDLGEFRVKGVAAPVWVHRLAGEAALASAAALMEPSGARTLAPALSERRAEPAAVLDDDVTRERLLRQAEQGYDEIGAPEHAARLRENLG